MGTLVGEVPREESYPVTVRLEEAIENRNRLTTAFRIVLAIPHLILVGGPIGLVLSWTSSSEAGYRYDWSAAGGVLGAVAAVIAVIAWFAIVFTGQQPKGLWNLAAFYLRWRVRAVAYTALLRDEYPPFGDEVYPAALVVNPPETARNRVTVGFRIFLVIPHVLVLCVLGIAWAVTSLIAWFAILLTGRYPQALYHFGTGVFRWHVRVDAYMLLLRDEYPPFSFE